MEKGFEHTTCVLLSLLGFTILTFVFCSICCYQRKFITEHINRNNSPIIKEPKKSKSNPKAKKSIHSIFENSIFQRFGLKSSKKTPDIPLKDLPSPPTPQQSPDVQKKISQKSRGSQTKEKRMDCTVEIHPTKVESEKPKPKRPAPATPARNPQTKLSADSFTNVDLDAIYEIEEDEGKVTLEDELGVDQEY